MLFWLSLAILSAVVLAVLLSPLLRQAAPSVAPLAADQAIYRDQLSEIDADRARGLIGEAEAEAARREIARRLLARAQLASASPVAQPAHPAHGRHPLVIAGVALMPAIALALYQSIGAPGLPSRPYAERAAAAIENTSVAELIARVEARLREHPEDGQGWDVIAPVYLRQERFREAADAYANALRLLGPSAKRLSGFAEATIIAGNGVVSEDARIAYEQALRLDPGYVEARFWLAMAKEQDGALAAAAADYRALLEAATPQSGWRGAVEERLAVVLQRLDADTDSSRANDRGRGEGPDLAAAAAMQNLSPQDRQQAIHSMVEGLAARLNVDGNDLNGWLRLVRAYKVLGQDEAAVTALGQARTAMQGNAVALSELEALAKSLGMGS